MNITIEMVLFGLAVFTAMGGAFWKIWGLIDSAKSAAAKAREEVADLRIHVAETYVSKAGHRESTEQIMDAINQVRDSINGIVARMDRFVDNQPARRTRST